jgi:hypothetical protein
MRAILLGAAIALLPAGAFAQNAAQSTTTIIPS